MTDHSHRPIFPLERSFILQIRGDSPTSPRLTGSLEHVAWGRVHRFDSLQELAAFVDRFLLRVDAAIKPSEKSPA